MQHQITINLDDSLYQPLIQKVGEDNLSEFFSSIIKPYLLLAQNNEPKPQGFLGLMQGDIQILDDIISPVVLEQEWTATQ